MQLFYLVFDFLAEVKPSVLSAWRLSSLATPPADEEELEKEPLTLVTPPLLEEEEDTSVVRFC